MKKILVLGAGLSSSSLIKYLLDNSSEHDWKITVGDIDQSVAAEKIAGHPNGRAIRFDIDDEKQKAAEVSDADVVISMLPARMHFKVARCCMDEKKHMITASYVSDEIKALDEEAQKEGVLFLNEIGVDPGIDHMSAMQAIHQIEESGGKLISFESSTGGLVAPEYDDNPWNYKFTWNPRNVVLAGQGVSRYLNKGRVKYIPYHKLFSRTQRITVLDQGEFDVYANRDSLKYQEVYGLEGIDTLFRGTLRRPGYTEAWDVFVQLGMTDDTYAMVDSENMTKADFLTSFLPYVENLTLKERLCRYLGIAEDSIVIEKLDWLGMFGDEKMGLKDATPAQMMKAILVPKWALGPEDKDMIVMQHAFIYEKDGKRRKLTSSMVVKGKDTVHTAMSITVGIPVAIATKLLLTDEIKVRGVRIPIIKDLYQPLLRELDAYGVRFVEEDVAL